MFIAVCTTQCLGSLSPGQSRQSAGDLYHSSVAGTDPPLKAGSMWLGAAGPSSDFLAAGDPVYSHPDSTP